MRIQREIAAYQLDCRINGTTMRVRNFKVVPLHSHRRKHILIDDSVTLKRMMEHLKIHPRKVNPITGRYNALDDAEFVAARVPDEDDPNREYNPHWFKFLRWNKVKQMERNSKEFHYEILTDGVSVSITFHRKTESTPESFSKLLEKQSEKYLQFGRNLTNNLYDTIIGVDPGYKVYIAALIKNTRTNEEKHIKISSKSFYSMTRQNHRDKMAKKWTDEYEAEAKLDRENFDEYPNKYIFMSP